MSIELEGVTITHGRNIIILSLNLNDKLNFKDHYKHDLMDRKGKIKKQSLIRILRQKTSTLKNLRKHLKPEITITAAKALLHGRYMYGITQWGKMSVSDARIIDSLRVKAARTAMGTSATKGKDHEKDMIRNVAASADDGE